MAPDGSWVAGTDPASVAISGSSHSKGHEKGYSRPVARNGLRMDSCSPRQPPRSRRNGLVHWADLSRTRIQGGRSPNILEGFKSDALTTAVSADGRLAAAAGGIALPEEGVIRIWDLESGEVQVLDPGDRVAITSLAFTPGG